jgi:hypothetical protein
MIRLRNIQLFSAAAVLTVAMVGPAMAQSEPATPQASPQSAASAAPAPAATPAASPAAPTSAPPATAGRIPAPPEGKGQVVFFRPSRFVGAALSFSVHEGDTGVGKLGNGSYFVLVAEPGPHAYSIQSEATDTLNTEVEPGETQYVQQTIGVGIMMGRPHLTPSDQATFDGMKSLKLSTKVASDLKPKAGT